MIYEYALEPEMVATWGNQHAYRFFIDKFGLNQGRILSRFPKKWARRVYDSFNGTSQMERKRLEELLVRIQETCIKRKGCLWDDAEGSWIKNALLENDRHPFRAILARESVDGEAVVLAENTLGIAPCDSWDTTHGRPVFRKAGDMAASVQNMLSCCRWVKFIDPYISPGSPRYQGPLRAFFNVLAAERPVGGPELIEIHTKFHDQTGAPEFLHEQYSKIIPSGLKLTLYIWQEKPEGQRFHNRYILTDIGGVSFHHGLDIGADNETDDVTRLDSMQYQLRCSQYTPTTSTFEPAERPLIIEGD